MKNNEKMVFSRKIFFFLQKYEKIKYIFVAPKFGKVFTQVFQRNIEITKKIFGLVPFKNDIFSLFSMKLEGDKICKNKRNSNFFFLKLHIQIAQSSLVTVKNSITCHFFHKIEKTKNDIFYIVICIENPPKPRGRS